MKELGRIITLPKIFDPRGNLTVQRESLTFPLPLPEPIGPTMCLAVKVVVVMPTRNVRNLSSQPAVPFPSHSITEKKRKPITSTTHGRGSSWMSISGEPSTTSHQARSVWSWLPTSLKKKTTSVSMTNISNM